MSGDCFNKVYYKVEYECIDELQKYMAEGLVKYGFNNLDDYKFMLHSLFTGYYKIVEAKIWMERLDYFLGYDDGEESFQERLNEELAVLASTMEKDKRCFDCLCMGNNGCALPDNQGKTITLTDFACIQFAQVDWSTYKVKELQIN